MNHKSWKILSWNVRGLNTDKKWNSIRDHVVESNCDIFCLQETKCSSFDLSFIHQFCPASFDSFEFLASVGASGGTLIVWKGALFSGSLVFQNT